MDLIERIKKNFNKGFFNKAMSIDGISTDYPAWTLKQDDWVGVAVPLSDAVSFSESFSSVRIRTEHNVLINGARYDLLMLTCNEMEYRNEFATICSQFVDPGTDGQKRIALISAPETWWNHWKFLLGNVSASKDAYPLLGELTALEWLLKRGISVRWSGIERGTHDIETPTCSYEVKSTIARYEQEVTISSIHQMKKSGETLGLIFCRFEKSLLGRSLDELSESLKVLGFPSDGLEQALKKEGYEVGRPARNVKYKLLEMKLYPVDKDFPSITEASFKENALPKCITKFTYTMDLSGVPCENLL